MQSVFPRSPKVVAFDGMRFSIADVHLIGKVLEQMDDEALKDMGFTVPERVRATWVFDDIDGRLVAAMGSDWNDQEVT
jgi:hypothetical protein